MPTRAPPDGGARPRTGPPHDPYRDHCVSVSTSPMNRTGRPCAGKGDGGRRLRCCASTRASEQEIAETMGIHPGTVESIVSRGPAELREMIEQ